MQTIFWVFDESKLLKLSGNEEGGMACINEDRLYDSEFVREISIGEVLELFLQGRISPLGSVENSRAALISSECIVNNV